MESVGILEAYDDLDKQAKREFDLEKIIRGTVQFTLKSIGESLMVKSAYYE